ncbi:hypothetical protein SMICM304S_02537 [Streptomyces microflavus]
MSWPITIASAAVDLDERGSEQFGQRLVPLVGHHATHVVRLHELRQISNHGRSSWCLRRAQRRCLKSRSQEVGGAQHPQVAPAGDFHRVRGARAPAPAVRAPVVRTGRFPYRVGQRFEIVTARVRRCGAVGEAHDLPAAWRGQPLTVLGTEVVAVGSA